MKNLFFLFLFLNMTALLAQGSSGTDAKFEYRSLVDMPTAGIVEKGFVGIVFDVMPMGVLLTKIEVGVFDNFSFGISYGGSNIIGRGKIIGNKLPGVNIRARVFDETENIPAILLGFDSQGKGELEKVLNRYQIKSPGFFIVTSKNFDFYGYLSIHGMINYSLESEDGDRDFNLQFGIEKTIGAKLSFIGEYDFGFNDNKGNSLGEGIGYLNFGFRWTLGDGLTLGLNLRDILSNKKYSDSSTDRGIFVEYIKAIF